MREEALVLVERAVSAGWSRSAACSELGLSPRTLDRWRSAVAFREVQVVDERGTVDGGCTIDVRLGALQARMSVETFAQLVRRLS